jgi:hypothetical protein
VHPAGAKKGPAPSKSKAAQKKPPAPPKNKKKPDVAHRPPSGRPKKSAPKPPVVKKRPVIQNVNKAVAQAGGSQVNVPVTNRFASFNRPYWPGAPVQVGDISGPSITGPTVTGPTITDDRTIVVNQPTRIVPPRLPLPQSEKRRAEGTAPGRLLGKWEHAVAGGPTQ